MLYPSNGMGLELRNQISMDSTVWMMGSIKTAVHLMPRAKARPA